MYKRLPLRTISTTQVKKLNKETAAAVKTGRVKKTLILEMAYERNFHKKNHKIVPVFKSITVKLVGGWQCGAEKD